MLPIFVPKVPNSNCLGKTTLGSVFRDKHASEVSFTLEEFVGLKTNQTQSVYSTVCNETEQSRSMFVSEMHRRVLFGTFSSLSCLRLWKRSSETCFSRKPDSRVVFLTQVGTFGTNIGGMWFYGICSAQLEMFVRSFKKDRPPKKCNGVLAWPELF